MREDFTSRRTTTTSKKQKLFFNSTRNSLYTAPTSCFISPQSSSTRLDISERDKIFNCSSLDPASIASYGSLPIVVANIPDEPNSINNIIGHFGLFQLLVLLFSGLRDACVGYDALVMSTLLQPEASFDCLSTSIIGTASGANGSSISDHCFTGDGLTCQAWQFPEAGWRPSLLVRWQLVCHRAWLVALLESVYFLGLMSGNLVWGYTADQLGRRRAYLISHSIALIFGCCSLVADNVLLFAVCRFLAAFGLTGYNIIYSIQVELIGLRYRALSTVLNHLGWGLGVVCVPLGARLFIDHRPAVGVVPILTLLM